MADDRVGEGQEISRKIREELDRIRESESRVEEALEGVRQARRRVEVIARELGREEERVRAWVRQELETASPRAGGDAGPTAPSPNATEPAPTPWRSDPETGWSTWREPPATPASTRPEGAPAVELTSAPADARADAPLLPTAPARPLTVVSDVPLPRVPADSAIMPPPAAAVSGVRRGRTRLFGGVALGLVAVGVVGWFALRGLREGADEQVAVNDPAVVATVPAPLPAEVAPAPDPGPSLAQLPADAVAREAFYDSLFAARSPLFDPLLTALDGATEDRAIGRAIASWKEGPVDAQDADLIHSALLQQLLKADTDPRIEIDGQVLRNPCRGGSCTALLAAWRKRREELGLPAVPSDAATNAAALRQAEAALVLDWMRKASTVESPTG